MHAEYIDAKKSVLLIAIFLLAMPIHAQTLQANLSSITLGQVIGCDDSKLLNVTSSGSQISYTATIKYPAGDIHPGWLYLKEVGTGRVTTGVTPALNLTVPAGATAGLLLGLNRQDAVVNTATLTLTTTNPAGQTLTIPVDIAPSLACPYISATTIQYRAEPASFFFVAAQGQSSTYDQIIYNTTTVPITISLATYQYSPWLSVGLTTVTIQPGQSASFPVTASAGTMAPGVYYGQFGIVGPVANEVTAIPVTFTVTTNGVGPALTAGIQTSSTSLNFNWTPEGLNLQPQVLRVSNASGSTPVPFTVSITQLNGPPNWLSTNYSAGLTTPFDLKVNVNTVGLNPSTIYQGTLTITPYLGPAVEVYVALNVAPPPVVTATPTSLVFAYTQGGAVPPFQQLLISGLNGAVVSYSTVAIIPSWLKAYLPTGNAPTTSFPNGAIGTPLNVVVDPSNLPVGTYTGTVTVYGNGPAVGNTNVAVTLVVSGPAIKTVASSASYDFGPIAPGEMLTLFADPTNPFGPTIGVPLTSDMIVDNQLPTEMADVQVLFGDNRIPAPLTYVSGTQINCVVPYEISGSNTVPVVVRYGSQFTNPMVLQTAVMQPGLFTSTSTGRGQGAIGQYDAAGNYLGVNSADNPVERGNVITLYVTGEGRTANSVTGRITAAQATAPYTPQPMVPPTVLIDGQPATVTFFGEVPGVVAGLMQINVIVPKTARNGFVTVSTAMGSSYSQAGVTLNVR